MKQLAFLVALILFAILGQGQSGNDLKLVFDSVLNSYKPLCGNIASSKGVSKKHINQDRKTVALFNELYHADLTVNEIREKIIKVCRRSRTWDFSQVADFGETVLYHGHVYPDGNINFEISVATYRGVVVSKRIEVKTKSMLDCRSPYMYGLHGYDILYLQRWFLPLIKAPVRPYENPVGMVIDTTFTARLNAVAPNYYPLLTGDSSRFYNSLTWHSMYAYVFHPRSSNPLESSFRVSQKEVLERFLFSPNHIAALYACEALSEYKETLSQESQAQMDKVLNSPVRISWFSGDYGGRGKTYKELTKG